MYLQNNAPVLIRRCEMKKRIFVVDEGQMLSAPHWESELLRLRHNHVVLIVGYQNASTADNQLSGNCDCHIVFQCNRRRLLEM